MYNVELLSWSLALQHEPSGTAHATLILAWVVISTSGKNCSSFCRSRRCWVGIFRLKCMFAAAFVCVCVAFVITGWVINRNNNFDRAETARNKLNAQTSYDNGICLNSCRLRCICWKPYILPIWYHLYHYVCREKVLSRNCPVGEISFGETPSYPLIYITYMHHNITRTRNSTQLNSTENYGRRCLTPLSPHRNYILS